MYVCVNLCLRECVFVWMYVCVKFVWMYACANVCFLSVCLSECIFVCINVCVNVCFVRMYVCVNVCLCESMLLQIYLIMSVYVRLRECTFCLIVCLCECMFVWMHVCVTECSCECMFAWMYMYNYIYVCVWVWVYICLNVCLCELMLVHVNVYVCMNVCLLVVPLSIVCTSAYTIAHPLQLTFIDLRHYYVFCTFNLRRLETTINWTSNVWPAHLLSLKYTNTRIYV